MFEDKRDNKSFNESNKFFMPDEDYKEPSSNFVRPRQNYNETNNNNNKNKNKVLLILIPILLIVIIIILAVTIILMLTKTKEPSAIYNDLIKDTFKNVKENIEEYTNKFLDYDFQEDSISYTGNLKLNTNLDILKDYNNTYQYNFILDGQNKALDLDVSYEEQDKNQKNIKAYIRDKILLFENKEIYSKLMNVLELKNFPWDLNFKKIDTTSINTILKFTENYFLTSLNKNKISKEKASINLNGTNYDVTNNSYKLTKEEVEKLIEDFFKEATKDNELLDALKNITGTSRMDIKNYIEKLASNENISEISNEITLNVYTRGKNGEVIALKVLEKDIEVLTKDYLNNKIILNIKGYKLEHTTVDKNQKIKITFEDNELGNITIAKNNDFTSINIDVEFNGYTIESDISIDKKGIGNKRLTLKVDFETVITYKKEKTILKFNLDNKTEVGTKTKTIDEKEYVNVNDLNNIEKKKIIAALEKIDSSLYKLWKQKLETEVTENEENCLNAYDCTCKDNNCKCKYLDDKYQEHEITCVK